MASVPPAAPEDAEGPASAHAQTGPGASLKPADRDRGPARDEAAASASPDTADPATIAPAPLPTVPAPLPAAPAPLPAAEPARTDDEPRPRTLWLTILLTVLQPGLGHMYLGRLGRGALLAGLLLAMVAPASWLMRRDYHGMLAALAMLLAGLIAVAWDAARLCRAGGFLPKAYTRWQWCVTAYAAMLAVGALYHESGLSGLGGLRSFKTAATSMADTLVPGDHFLTDLTAYASGRGPEPGDVLVFRVPGSPELAYVKRVAALPGQRVLVEDARVLVDGRELDLYRHAPPGGRASGLPRQVEYLLRDDEYFLLGDNADQSMDSRFFGPVPAGNLLGRALYIYWSPESGRAGRDLRQER